MITLFHTPKTRSGAMVWLLEELGAPYQVELVNLDAPREPAYLALNPSGKVPTLVDGDLVMTESAAITIYLADRYGLGTLAPALDDPARGPYLAWIIYRVACAEPAFLCAGLPEQPPAPFAGWGSLDTVVERLSAGLVTGPWLLGERFTAADVLIGGAVRWGILGGYLPKRAEFEGYLARLANRTAYQRAQNVDAELLAQAG